MSECLLAPRCTRPNPTSRSRVIFQTTRFPPAADIHQTAVQSLPCNASLPPHRDPLMQTAIALCKQRLPLHDLLVRLGLFQNPPGPGSHPCPLHQERKGAAFSMHCPRGAWLWKCHGKCSASGDEISLLRFIEGISNRAAIQRYKELCGHPGGDRQPKCQFLRPSAPENHSRLQPMIQLPDRLHLRRKKLLRRARLTAASTERRTVCPNARRTLYEDRKRTGLSGSPRERGRFFWWRDRGILWRRTTFAHLRSALQIRGSPSLCLEPL